MEGCEESAERLEALQILNIKQFAEMTGSLLEKALELAAYENDSEKPEMISAGRLVRLLIEASLMNSESKGVALPAPSLLLFSPGYDTLIMASPISILCGVRRVKWYSP